MRGFGIANYRSFSSEGVWFPELSKINIFIGKNNAGKSNILKFLRDLAEAIGKPNQSALRHNEQKHWSEGDPPSLDIDIALTELGLNWEYFALHRHNHPDLRPLDQSILRFRYDPIHRKFGGVDPFAQLPQAVRAAIWRRLGAPAPSPEQIRNILGGQNWESQVFQFLQQHFKNVFYVQQFREIREESGSLNDERHAAGYHLAQRLGIMKSPGERRNAEQMQFYQIRDWIRELLDLPDLEIDIEHPGGEKPNAVLLKTNGLRRYLESFGTGIHQLVILCFAISLKTKHIVCIEEPESFLHPTLQRGFLEFLRKTDNTYFLSTHSNVFLDAAKQNDTRIYHVAYEGRASKVTRVETTPDSYRVLEDLGYHASDLLQSNGVIWVEGPTDRLYLLKWLELSGCRAKEDTDFTIMFYAGRLLSHLSFCADLSAELIPLLRLNRNAIVMLDSERTAKGQHLKKSRRELVSRISSELLSARNGLVWVTQGRDIENYISKATLERFAEAKWNGEFRLQHDHFRTLDEMIRWGKTRRKKFNYSSAKVEYCREILAHITKEDLDVLDLKSKLTRIAAIIDSWCPRRIPAAERG